MSANNYFLFLPLWTLCEAWQRLTGANFSAGSEGRRFTGAISASAGSEGATISDNSSEGVASELSLNEGPCCQLHE
ncbi:hypothetical protein EDB19DRAFT_463455 [Suillus lakei]|nr:hypothetical protein EDB19DRAFT_463455 [Suillus lakei]